MSVSMLTNYPDQSARNLFTNGIQLESRDSSTSTSFSFQSKTFVCGAILGGVLVSYLFYKFNSAQTPNLNVPSLMTLSQSEVLSKNMSELLRQQERNSEEFSPVYLQSLKQSIGSGDSACVGAHYSKAEEFYANALQESLRENNRVGEAISLQKLAELYITKGTRQNLVQAAGMYQYILLCLPENQQLIKQILVEIEAKLIVLCNGIFREKEVLLEQLESNAKILKSLRDNLDEKIQKMTEHPSPQDVVLLYREINMQLKGFIKGLMDQVIELQGEKSPCFAAIGFGSLAREEMTPYSDLEFGILLDENTEKNKEYFRNFTYLLHLKVINLGETILRALNIPCLSTMYSLDRRTPRGFAFDGEGVKGKGCKTPLGNRNSFELIQTPEEMAKYQEKDPAGNWWFEKEPHLPMELSTFIHLAGDEKLVEKYQKAMDTQLKVPYKEFPSLREFYAREHLRKEDEKTFDPTLQHHYDEGRLLQVKQDLYRLPHLLIDRLTLLSDCKLPEQSDVRSQSTFDRIDRLCRQKVISEPATNNLLWLISMTCFQRLKVYSKYKKQCEAMNALLSSSTLQDPSEYFSLNPQILENLINIYQILIPLYRHGGAYLRRERESLLVEDFRELSFLTRGIIEERFMQYERALKSYLQAEKENPGSFEIMNLIGISLLKLGRADESLDYHRKALLLTGDEIFLKAATHGCIGSALEALGNVEQAIEQKKEAHRVFQTLRKTVFTDKETDFLVKNTTNLAMSYKSRRKDKSALELLKEAKEKIERIYPNDHPQLSGVLSNMSLVYIQTKEFDDALNCLNRARTIDEKFFGMQHPFLARDFVNLGLLERNQGKDESAISFYEKALSIYTSLGFIHPQLGATYRNLGIAQKKLGNLQESILNYKKALEAILSIDGKNHHRYIYCLIDLGTAYRSYGKPEAIQYLEEARKALSTLAHHEKYRKQIDCLNELGLAYKTQRNLDQAVNCLKEALEISKQHSSEVRLSAKEQASLLYTFGIILVEKKELGEGIIHFNKAVEIAERGQIDPRLIDRIKKSIENAKNLQSKAVVLV
jgi:tetratricopeptide (TPR) repeat protein